MTSLLSKVRSFWDDRPCNINHSLLPIGTKEYFNEVEKRKYFVEPHIAPFADFPRWRDKHVLELGVGIGTDCLNFIRHGANYTGIDLSEKSLDLCRKRLEVFDYDYEYWDVSQTLNTDYHISSLKKVKLVCGNIEEVDFFLPSTKNSHGLESASHRNKFDLIYAFGVLHHTPRPAVVLNQIKRRLKPGGELRLMIYSKYSYKLFHFMRETDQWDFSAVDEVIAYYAEAQTKCPQALTYTVKEACELLSDFNIIDIHKDHIFKYNIPEYMNGKYIIEDCFKDMPIEDFNSMESELGWHLLIRASLK